jgi:hypothetical protein
MGILRQSLCRVLHLPAERQVGHVDRSGAVVEWRGGISASHASLGSSPSSSLASSHRRKVNVPLLNGPVKGQQGLQGVPDWLLVSLLLL